MLSYNNINKEFTTTIGMPNLEENSPRLLAG